ncbi:MAG: hypothetical protein AAGB51_06970 [Planctomycetota bacterium]
MSTSSTTTTSAGVVSRQAFPAWNVLRTFRALALTGTASWLGL